MSGLSERLTNRLARRIDPPKPSRRGFLGGATLVGAALAADPLRYLTRPASAYDSICGSDNTCAAGYSVFCCTINGGQNACPPDSFVGGWWKADNSSFCGGSARYYIDCNAYRDHHYTCHCNTTTCDQRLVACNQFRYGQCNTQIPYSQTGPVVCRLVSCAPPWQQFAGVCGTTSATDNNTATHSAPCLSGPPAAGPLPRIAVVRRDGSLFVKEGALSAGWTLEATGVRAAALAGNRIGILGADGVVRVKDGPLSAGWVTEAASAAGLALTSNRIAVLGTDGGFQVKTGGLSTSWVTEAVAVARIAVSDTRIGIVGTDGSAAVKDGGLLATWQLETDNAADIALAGDRIGVLGRDGTIRVKEGGLSAGWVTEATGCTALALAGSRLAVRTVNGQLFVKDGPLGGPWALVADAVTSFAVTATRIAVVRTDGTVLVKEGGLSAGWVTETSGGAAVVLS